MCVCVHVYLAVWVCIIGISIRTGSSYDSTEVSGSYDVPPLTCGMSNSHLLVRTIALSEDTLGIATNTSLGVKWNVNKDTCGFMSKAYIFSH